MLLLNLDDEGLDGEPPQRLNRASVYLDSRTCVRRFIGSTTSWRFGGCWHAGGGGV